jgi:hypothetical protein
VVWAIGSEASKLRRRAGWDIWAFDNEESREYGSRLPLSNVLERVSMVSGVAGGALDRRDITAGGPELIEMDLLFELIGTFGG